MNKLILKPGREKSMKRRHPWVFSGAVEKAVGEPQAGDTIAVQSSDGAFLAYAAYSPKSQIVARAWSFHEADIIDANFVEARLAAAIRWRDNIFASGKTNAARLIHAESDGLPGLIVDRYADTLVVQFLSAGIERWREAIVAILTRLTGCARIFERSDADVRELEGLKTNIGALLGDAPGASIEIVENGIQYYVDVEHGQKTGFYLDQRDNRQYVAEQARGRRVLNAFCYTGGFTLAALKGGAASALSIDSSADALALGRRNAEANGITAESCTWMEADIFKELRTLRDRNQPFDMIVLDPPKFAPTAAHAEKASRAYKDINLYAFKLLAPGGLLVTFSCSGGIGVELFQKIVAGAAADANVEAQIIGRLSAASDHPVSIHFPEGDYLKGLVVRRTS